MKRAIPLVARDEVDGRERFIQGDVYRRAHSLVIGWLAIGVGLLEFNPAIGTGLARHAHRRGSAQGVSATGTGSPCWMSSTARSPSGAASSAVAVR
jgi:hypothetical protein